MDLAILIIAERRKNLIRECTEKDVGVVWDTLICSLKKPMGRNKCEQ